MKNKLLYLFFVLTVAAIGIFFLDFNGLHYGGDIVEYYGTTQSFINHLTPALTSADQKQVEQVLNPAYFTLPDYYLVGRDSLRYPVHFIAYPLLLMPVRLLLELFHHNVLDMFRITNLLLFAGFVLYGAHRFFKTTFKQAVFILIMLLSPLLSFLVWPGPDVLYAGLVLLSVFFFFEKRLMLAAVLMGLASWQSQPLAVTAFGLTIYALFRETVISRDGTRVHVSLNPKSLFLALLTGIIVLIPYAYNYWAFGMLSPWTAFPDDWTRTFGFGLQNVSLKKFYEQFFNLDMGLFWYMPVLFIGSTFAAYKTLTGRKKPQFAFQTAPVVSGPSMQEKVRRFTNRFSSLYRFNNVILDKQTLFIIVLFLVTAFFYQTNPAWNYGTAGYGPTRHILFMLPLLVYFFMKLAKPTKRFLGILTLVILTQGYVLWFNGFITPDFMNSLAHTPYAQYVLDNYPELYNPTPEIFVDRTNHTDKFIASAVYKYNGTCTKAYVLPADIEAVAKECGYFPKAYRAKLADPLSRKSTRTRSVTTREVTFWPDAFTCDYPLKSKQYVCMFTRQDFVRYTGVKDMKRIHKISGYKGVWQVTWGDPITVSVPPGYTVDYYSIHGVYVNF